MKALLPTLLVFFCCNLTAQVTLDTLVDDRDHRQYATVKIDGLEWFRDNLKYETLTSFCPSDSKSEKDCQFGNFYSYTELDTVCPSNWRIPNEQDWQSYFNFRLRSKNGSLQDVRLDTIVEEYLSVIYRDTTSKVSLLDGKNPLAIAEFGWVQGKKKQDWGTTTFWIRNSKVDDSRFHLHVRKQNFTIHRHAHNIEDRKRKNRRFMVKCVRDIDDKF